MKFYKANKDGTFEQVTAMMASSAKVQDLVVFLAGDRDWRVCDYYSGAMIKSFKTRKLAMDFAESLDDETAAAILRCRQTDKYKRRCEAVIEFAKSCK